MADKDESDDKKLSDKDENKSDDDDVFEPPSTSTKTVCV